MDVSTIIRQVTRNIKDQNGDIIDLINRCLDDLTPIDKREALKTTSVVVENKYELPSDLFQIYKVFIDDLTYNQIPLSDKTSTGFKRWEEEISFQDGPDAGTIELYYYRKLNKVSSTTDIPEIEEPFHDLFILFALGHLQWMKDDYEFRPDALNRYYQRKEEYRLHIERKDQEEYIIEEDW